ncbi:hypothetical protein [Bradyrhizobium elkanii]
MAKPQSLEERIIQIRKECDEIIDRHVAEIRKTCEGVPDGIIRREVEKKAWGCPCAQTMHLMGKANELAG